MYEGNCLCEGVRYQIHGELRSFVFCHCSKCRRAQGSAFAANAVVNTAEFQVLTGRELIKEYQGSPGKFRCFCGNCGSPLYSRREDKPEVLRVRVGTVTT